ncbi:MAG: NADH-quinone oxidoreductase subunit C [Thermodesulfobacteriota bacterium]|nr:NADH-quinone oxidoreductase subunit C [Thermodesulfobacteriota bacterium]
MSIVEETRIALLDLFPELAAADAEARAAAQAEAEAAAEAATADTVDDETQAIEPAAEGDAPAGGDDEVEAAEAVAESEPEPEEPEEDGPRENGVMLTDHAARGTDIDVLCDPDQVVQAAKIMDEAGFYLEAITGVDWIKDEKLEVMYDYNQFGQEQCRVVVRTLIPRSEPEIQTISDIMPSANWHERETHDFYGIKFAGHPHLIPILLPEDADFHPLLKDFKP